MRHRSTAAVQHGTSAVYITESSISNILACRAVAPSCVAVPSSSVLNYELFCNEEIMFLIILDTL